MPTNSDGLVCLPDGFPNPALRSETDRRAAHFASTSGERELVNYPVKHSTTTSPNKKQMSKEASYPGGISFPSWQSDLQAAVNESDPEKLLARVHAAEISIFNRLQELGKFPPQDELHQRERESIAKALETLRLLKRDRLGFPDWTQK